MAKKGIRVLIKLKRREVDELRKEMAGYERQRETLMRVQFRLNEEYKDEVETVTKSPEMGGYFGAYSERVRKRQEDIRKEMSVLDQRMADLRVKIADAFGEAKRYEIVEENARKRAQKEADRREQITLDEIGSVQFRRLEENA